MSKRVLMDYRKLGIILTLFFLSGTLFSQQVISGKVISSENAQPVQGATVTVKATGRNTSTDATGMFKVTADNADMLVISNIGFITKEVNATDALTITLMIDAKSMNEVVVTALGIKKEVKRLGYSV